jgi:hypothetical protein
MVNIPGYRQVKETHFIPRTLHRILLSTLFISLFLILFSAVLPVWGASIDSLSVTSGAAGTSVGFVGSNYTPNYSFNVTFAPSTNFSTIVRSGNVTGTGTLSGTFLVPQIPGGTYNVTITTANNSASANFTVTPVLSINANSYRVGDPVTVSGTGFGANRTVTISFESTTVTTAQTNGNGVFSAAFNVPSSQGGVRRVGANDGAYNLEVFPTVIQSIVISPATAHIDDVITITGTGFGGSRPVDIQFDGATVTSTTTDGSGSFSATFNVPPSQAGPHTVTASDGIYSPSAILTTMLTMTISPTTAHVGDALTVTGSGFGPGRTVNIQFDSVTVTSVAVDGNGSFSVTFNVPPGQAGPHSITAGDGINSQSVILTVMLSMTISSTNVHVGDVLTINGSGFGGSRTVNIQVDGIIVYATTSDAYGSFSATFTVAPNPAGAHSISAGDGVNSKSATIIVEPAIMIGPTIVRVGDTVTIIGTGFGGSRTINIQFEGITLMTATSDAYGSFSATFNVPPSQAGEHIVAAGDGVNGQSDTLTVIPSMTMSPTTVHVGDAVTVSGKGFGGSRTVTIQLDGVSVTATTSSPEGSFTTVFNLPAGRTGAHTVITSDGINSQSASLTITQLIAVNPKTAHVGDPITVTGTGFGGSRTINLQFDGTTVASANSSAAGSFTAIFNMPAAQTGTHIVTAGDGLVSQSANLSITQFIAVNPTTVHVGDPITVTGTGFGGSRTINLQFDGTTVASANSSAGGSFTAIFNTPAAQTGTHVIAAVDGLVSQSANLSVSPSMKTSTVSAHVGEQVEIAGTGFASAKNIVIQYDNTNVATIAADTYGSFIGVFKIPASQAGTNLVTVGDGQNNLSANVSIISLITLGPTSGIPGATVTVSGTGFNSNRSVSIAYADATVSTTPATVITDNAGSFSGNFTVPWLNVNSYKVTASDGPNTATAGFALITSFNIKPNSGNVSSNVTVNGSGFSGLVTVKYDGRVVASVASGTNGSISTVFSVPVSVHGSHNITVNDAVTTLQTGFVMESVPPPAPVSLPFAKGPKQRRQPTFVWQPVSDPSGLTYTFQIGTDATFSNVTLEKPGLTTLNYTLTDIEKLPSTTSTSPYYWRVRAVDLASNEGDWSQSIPFSVSFLPDWAAYSLIVLGSVAAGLGIFWFGFITGRRPPIVKTGKAEPS